MAHKQPRLWVTTMTYSNGVAVTGPFATRKDAERYAKACGERVSEVDEPMNVNGAATLVSNTGGIGPVQFFVSYEHRGA